MGMEDVRRQWPCLEAFCRAHEDHLFCSRLVCTSPLRLTAGVHFIDLLIGAFKVRF